MTRDELRRLIKNEDYSYPWEKDNSSYSLDDIDDESLEKYYQEAVNCGRLEMPVYNKEGLLTILELYSNGVLKNAAFALFGKNADIQLKLACFATNEKITFLDLNEKKRKYLYINK
jgi:ATP-dependent DNA helicase RecG